MAESLTNALAEAAVVDIDGKLIPNLGSFMAGKRAILFVNVATK